jgi:hypothetical protein
MTDGQSWGMLWYFEGEEIGQGFFEWTDGPEGVMTASFNNNDGSSLQDGNYVVELYAGTGDEIPLLSQGEVTVGGGGGIQRPNKDDGVQVGGQIIDNDTQRGIKDFLPQPKHDSINEATSPIGYFTRPAIPGICPPDLSSERLDIPVEGYMWHLWRGELPTATPEQEYKTSHNSKINDYKNGTGCCLYTRMQFPSGNQLFFNDFFRSV